MSQYMDALAALKIKKEKLTAREVVLVQKRKSTIGDLAEQFNLLCVSDAIIVGIFSELQKNITNASGKVKEWEQEGARFCARTRRQSTTKKT